MESGIEVQPIIPGPIEQLPCQCVQCRQQEIKAHRYRVGKPVVLAFTKEYMEENYVGIYTYAKKKKHKKNSR